MTTNHIKAILTSLRAMVVKMLPAYKFYLGSTTETVAAQICHGVMSVKEGQTSGNGALTLDDASFAGFVEGETYTVVVNGVSGEYVAKLLNGNVMVTNIAELENPTEDYWAAAFVQGMCVYDAGGTYANATISISQTKTVTTKKYQTKKLDKSLLPDGVESGIEAANTKATDALSAAQDAQDTANQAVSDAATAQSAADTAQTTANTAKSTADTAKSTADTAQSTADACVKKQNPVQFNITLGKTSDLNRFVGAVTNNGAEYGCSVVDGSTASFSVGSQSRNMEIVVKATEKPEVIFYPPINLTNQADFEFRRLTSAYNHPLIKGLGGIVLYSSTSGSTKKFKITVDDTGTLSATEVTDA